MYVKFTPSKIVEGLFCLRGVVLAWHGLVSKLKIARFTPELNLRTSKSGGRILLRSKPGGEYFSLITTGKG